MADAFVYSWSDCKTSKIYVGVHKGFDDDGYVCSSKSMLKEFKERPHDFNRQIIAKGIWSDCIVLEAKINKQLIKNIDTTYNRHAFPTIVNEVHPMLGKTNREGGIKGAQTVKLKRAENLEYNQYIFNQKSKGRIGKISPRKGVILSEETKLKMSENNFWKGRAGPNTGKKFSEESKEKMRESALKKPEVSLETKKKLSESSKKSWAIRKMKAGNLWT